MKKRITFCDIVNLQRNNRKNPFFNMLIVAGKPPICTEVKLNFQARAPPFLRQNNITQAIKEGKVISNESNYN